MKKQEAAFTTAFLAYAREAFPPCALELKHTRGSVRFRCSELKEHQYNSLMAVTSWRKGFSYKIPDDGISYKPFDAVVLHNTLAFVVIRFPKGIVVIHIHKFPRKTKSLTYEQAVRYAWTTLKVSDLR